MSIHTWKAINKAARMGGYAANRDAEDLWNLSKRELLEIALRLGELCTEDGEGGIDNAIKRVREESVVLRANGII
jgi:hypothetical protein